MKKKIRKTLTIVCLAAILAFAQLLWAQPVATNCTPAPGGIVSWWPADGYALDVVGTNNGTLEDGAGYAGGEVGQAFSFNGSNSYVSLPNNFFPFPFSGTGTEPFTIELWFKTTSGGVIFSQEVGPVGGSFASWDPGIYVGTDGKLRAEVFWSGSVTPMTSSAAVNDGVFHHTAVTYDGTNAVLFLDGKSVQTNKQSQVGYASTYYYQFGVAYTASWPGGNGGWYYFVGQIDEPTLYSRALSPEEIAAIHSAGASGKCFSSGLAPVFVQQPGSTAAILGDWLTLSGAATGTPPPTYQWLFDNVAIANATNPLIAFSFATTNESGSYKLIASNIFGSVTSAVAKVNAETNLLVNGNFESGNTGFSSGYPYSPGNLIPAGVYDVVHNPHNDNSGQLSMGDHTSGIGLMMAVNGGSNPALSVWSETVNVATNENYAFSGWIADVDADDGSPPELVFSVNGTQIGTPFELSPYGGTWWGFTNLWSSKSSTQAVVEIRDLNTVAEGNDFALDDLSFVMLPPTPPSIIQQPASVITNQGATVMFTVGATGSAPLAYQWQFDGTNLDGATDSTLTLLSVQTNEDGLYSVIVTNAAGSASSSNAFLVVNAETLCNWDFSSPPLSTEVLLDYNPATSPQQPWNFTGSSGVANDLGNATSSFQASNPSYPGQYAFVQLAPGARGPGIISRSVYFGAEEVYSIAYLAAGRVSSPAGSGGDLLYAVKIAPNIAGTVVLNVTNNTTNGQPFTAEQYEFAISSAGYYTLSFTAAQGFGSYDDNTVLLDDISLSPFPGQGQITGKVTCSCDGTPVIEAVVQVGTQSTLTDDAGDYALSGLPSGTYALSVSKTNYVTTTNSITISSCASEVTNDFSLTIFSNAVGPEITRQPSSVVTNAGANVVFAVGAIGTAPLFYQWQFDGGNLDGATNSMVTLTNVLISQAGTYTVIVSNVAGITNSSNAVLTVLYPPQVSIVNPTPGSVFNTGVPITITADVIPGSGLITNLDFYHGTTLLGQATQSPYSFIWENAPQGINTLTAAAFSNDGLSATSSPISISVVIPATPPIIAQQPASVTTNRGPNASFTVVATGTQPLGYQWRFDGSSLEGATNATLTLTNVQISQTGTYSVIVSNVAGITNSSNAVLTVLYPPQVSIVTPAPGSVFNTGSPVTITASVVPGIGLVTNVDFYDGAALLGQANQSPYSFIWMNAPQGTASLTAVAFASDRLSATSSPVSISIIVPTNKPVITLVSPANQSTFCPGTAIPLVAMVMGGSSAPASVSFYADSTALLGSVTAASDDVQWTNAAEGSYSVTAVATFPDGSTLTSSAAEVTISNQCGQVAIVSGSVTPEISLMENGLSNRMGLTYAVFNPAEATVGVLTPYKLVIWDDLDGGTNQITGSTVGVLANVFGAGIPLYLIGPHLAQDALALSPSEQSEWIGLTGLTPPTGVGGDGGVEFTNTSESDPIVDGSFGTATNFAAAVDFDLTTVTNSSATVVGQSGAIPVMVAYPGFGVAASGQARMVTQNFEVGGGSDTNSLAQRQILFLNAVCWLTDCSICTLVGVAPKADVTPNPAIVGAPVTFNWTVANDGDCAGTGVVLSCPLPAGAQFVGAAADSGGSQDDSLQNQVVFQLGQLPRGSDSVSYTLIFQQGGVFTNTMNVSVIGIPPVQAQTTVQVNGLNLLPTGASGYQMQFTGNANQAYEIQTSTDLINWLNWSNIVGPNWQITLPAPSPSGPPRQFFRALGQ